MVNKCDIVMCIGPYHTGKTTWCREQVLNNYKVRVLSYDSLLYGIRDSSEADKYIHFEVVDSLWNMIFNLGDEHIIVLDGMHLSIESIERFIQIADSFTLVQFSDNLAELTKRNEKARKEGRQYVLDYSDHWWKHWHFSRSSAFSNLILKHGIKQEHMKPETPLRPIEDLCAQ